MPCWYRLWYVFEKYMQPEWGRAIWGLHGHVDLEHTFASEGGGALMLWADVGALI